MNGSGDGIGARKRVGQTLGSMGGRVGPWRESHDRLENAVEMEGREADCRRKLRRAGRGFGALDQAARAGHGCRVAVGHRQIGTAALARPEPRAFRSGRTREKAHVLTPRKTRPTRRPAVDASGPHRVVERAIGAGIAVDHRIPARFVVNELQWPCRISCAHGSLPRTMPQCQLLNTPILGVELQMHFRTSSVPLR